MAASSALVPLCLAFVGILEKGVRRNRSGNLIEIAASATVSLCRGCFWFCFLVFKIAFIVWCAMAYLEVRGQFMETSSLLPHRFPRHPAQVVRCSSENFSLLSHLSPCKDFFLFKHKILVTLGRNYQTIKLCFSSFIHVSYFYHFPLCPQN